MMLPRKIKRSNYDFLSIKPNKCSHIHYTPARVRRQGAIMIWGGMLRMEVLRARSYLRVSTDEQAMEGFSLSAQEEKCRQFIESQGWQYDGEYIDDGYSAKDLNRPAMQQMIRDINEKQFDILVVYRLDRL